MRTLTKIEEIYGNRGAIFDLSVALIITSILHFLGIGVAAISGLIGAKFEPLISFLGIIVGFLLTSLSLLFLYNPEHSKELTKLRKHKAYKKILNAFVSTSFFSIILAVVFLLVDMNTYPFLFLTSFLFVVLRIFKCLYHLYAIITLSQ